MSRPTALTRRYRVRGHSMYPALRDGDIVTVQTGAYVSRRPVVGELVLARHPFKGGVEMVKRVAEIACDGRLVLHGDDPLESEDSRAFGPVSPDLIVGRVIQP